MLKFKTEHKKIIGDKTTPVILYLQLRDKFAGSILLESSDYSDKNNAFSYIACDQIAEFKLQDQKLSQKFPDQKNTTNQIIAKNQLEQKFSEFIAYYQADNKQNDFISNGLFGYCSYDAIEYFENIDLKAKNNQSKNVPQIWYRIFRYVIAFDHFKNEIHLFKHHFKGDKKETLSLDEFEVILANRNYPSFSFSKIGQEISHISEDQYLKNVQKGIYHCKRGDVYQVVLSRSFALQYKGDEFNVYRALRSINPSPYLFYFDYVDFSLFGSSPEMQISIRDKQASIMPIAGTYKRDDNTKDEQLAKAIKKDAKELSEHTMLVDLARNDLSKYCHNVFITKNFELQYYSHLVHLVSQVQGELLKDTKSMQLFANTFPAGTLSGAPKYKAMQIIDEIEQQKRSFYGGAIGWWGFDDCVNHAIMIRSFLSQNNYLNYQAGAGIVSKSKPINELNEVKNKLGALRAAINTAQDL